MNFISIVHALVLIIIPAITILFLYEFFKYQKLRRRFNKDYLTEYRKGVYRKIIPIIPRRDSKRYKRTEAFIHKLCWNISVEQFYVYKSVLLLIGIVIILSMQITNQYYKIIEIEKDVNYKKIMLDNYIQIAPEAVKLELNLYDYIDKKVDKGNKIYNANNSDMYIEYIQSIIPGSGININEAVEIIAARMFEKVKAVRAIKLNLRIYILGILMAFLLFFIPDMLGYIKIRLIEDKKDWEVLNCIYVFSIFGRLPPYSIRPILESMSMVTEAYKPIINNLLEKIKKGYGEKAFDELLTKTENEELNEMIETMKLSCDTGILNAVDNIDELAGYKLKWMEIKGLKRRKMKRVYAMTLVALMFLLAGIYFSYGLTVLSNPSFLIPMN